MISNPAKAIVTSHTEPEGSFFDSNLQDLYAYVLRRVGAEADTEDIVAETFAEALRHHGKCRAADCRPWLFGIARRKIANYYRKTGVRRQVGLSSEIASTDQSPLAAAVRGDEAGTLRRLVDGLPADQREVLVLHYVEEFTPDQIAVAIGRSRFAVNSLLQRARRRLLERGAFYFGEDDLVEAGCAGSDTGRQGEDSK